MSRRATTVPVYHPSDERPQSSAFRLFQIWMLIGAIFSAAVARSQGWV